MQLYCSECNIAIYPDINYYWRVRSKKNSITQSVFKTKNIRDRVFVTREIIKIINNYDENLIDTLYEKLLKIDILQFINELSNCDDEFKEIMNIEVKPFTQSFYDNSCHTLNEIEKLKYDLFLNGYMENLITLIEKENEMKNRIIGLTNSNRFLENTVHKKNEEVHCIKSSKDQLNKEYDKLSKDYKTLKLNAESLKKENEKLNNNNQKLKNEIKIIKSTKGWFNYKIKNILFRIKKHIK